MICFWLLYWQYSLKKYLENNIRNEERDKNEVERAQLFSQIAHFQKMYQEKKEENERLLESESEKGALADLLPKNEIGKKHASK